MNRVQIVRGVGDVTWWVFVVAALVAQPFRDTGWAGYVPLTDRPDRYATTVEISFADYWTTGETIATLGLVAVGVTLMASLVGALYLVGWKARTIGIAGPIVGAAVVAIGADNAPGWSLVAFVSVLAGIALREACVRWAAGRTPRTADLAD